MEPRGKYLWITDTHTKIFDRYKLLNTILDANPVAVMMTGDISEGFAFLSDLDFLGRKIGRPLYLICGNHELWGSSFAKTHQGIRNLTDKHKNLIWMDQAGIVPINEETCLIGRGNWYDARSGNPNYIKYTFDWWMIEDFRKLSNMKDRIDLMRSIADESTRILSLQLEEAIEKYKMVYMLVHVPPFREAHRAHGWISDNFWEPYNTNIFLGQELEKVMQKHKKRKLVILSGHCHVSMTAHIAPNIECRVGKGSYRKISEEEIIYI
jgi:predicted phosphohydrolase